MRKLSRQMNKNVYMAVIAAGVWMAANPVFAGQLANEREIDLKGTTNTRDIGGYQTDDLRTLRSGQIIRSENLSRLTAADFRKLEGLGLKTVIDLRTQQEHDRSPTVWQGDNPPQFHHFPVGDSDNDWFNEQRNMMRKNRFTEEESLALMVEGYHMIAEEGIASYQQLMAVVLDQSNWPVLIHCNAGKDRAGVAVTLIMEALGVDRETIMEEFLLTNELGRSQEKAVLMSKEGAKSGRRNSFRKGPSAEAWFPIVGVRPEMLEAYYANIDERYGSMDAFLLELGVDQQARGLLADSLTTAQPELAMAE
ncbi:MAG: tyrosine-protein phosphatase [Xanthomonadales bacterium]|nr:tyrosine-protein phosphatase [Xanthomonadales bacterium]